MSKIENIALCILQSGEEANAQALEGLLSPHGKLFRAMQSADADGLIRFMFPLERLPTHTQLLLASEGGRHVIRRHLFTFMLIWLVLSYLKMWTSPSIETGWVLYVNKEGAGALASV